MSRSPLYFLRGLLKIHIAKSLFTKLRFLFCASVVILSVQRVILITEKAKKNIKFSITSHCLIEHLLVLAVGLLVLTIAVFVLKWSIFNLVWLGTHDSSASVSQVLGSFISILGIKLKATFMLIKNPNQTPFREAGKLSADLHLSHLPCKSPCLNPAVQQTTCYGCHVLSFHVSSISPRTSLNFPHTHPFV